MTDEILLVGLDREAASIGLALRSPKLEVSLAGYDPDKKVAREALQAKRIDRMLGSLREVSSECDLCLVSLPPEAMIPALETLGAALPDGALIVGLGALQSPILAWVSEHLPSGRHYIGIVPVEGAAGIEVTTQQDDSPRADRFSGGVMALALPPGTPQSSIDVALSLAALLGARPFFIEPVELDAATAAVATFPALLAGALMSMSARQPGWRDARRLTGPSFARATALIDEAAPRLSGASLSLQRHHLLPRLEAMQAELAEWHALIEAGTDEALEQRLRAASRGHDDWLSARRTGDWGAEELSPAPPVSGPSVLERMFSLGRRRGKSSSG
jgi:prephenate dehydrogenase